MLRKIINFTIVHQQRLFSGVKAAFIEICTQRDRIYRGRKGHKNKFLVYVKVNQQLTLPELQLLVNPKFLRCKSFLQRKQGGTQSIYVPSPECF